MSTPSPEAKQVAEKINNAVFGNRLSYYDQDRIAEIIDAATAQLRAGLEQEKLDFEKEVSDHYAESHREFKRQLAHQQLSSISKMCPHCNKGKIFPNTHHCPACNYRVYYEEIATTSATTPDVEKIAREIACKAEFISLDEIQALLAQAREPLATALEACDPAHIWDAARQHFTGSNAPICDVLTEHRDKLIEIRRAALTGTKET